MLITDDTDAADYTERLVPGELAASVTSDSHEGVGAGFSPMASSKHVFSARP